MQRLESEVQVIQQRNALIPTVAFFLSMRSLPLVKHWWMKRGRGKS